VAWNGLSLVPTIDMGSTSLWLVVAEKNDGNRGAAHRSAPAPLPQGSIGGMGDRLPMINSAQID
jgi:hypothetical protein